MNDPWDVQSVRLSDQYVSCMKINGVPLLPPLLSQQCRKEMQYYKLLAKEVEKRIAHLKTFHKDCSSSEDSLHVSETLDCEFSTPRGTEPYNDTVKSSPIKPLLSSSPTSPVSPEEKTITDNGDNIYNSSSKSSKKVTLPLEIPERDCSKTELQESEKEIITDTEEHSENHSKQYDYDMSSDLPDAMFHGPSSLSSKSFTGSLNDLHSDVKEMDLTTKLVRQNSYTILKPSPQLMAHLQVQSQSTGMDIMSISMSESLSNISSPHKKRRSWDLETAKVKWSSMAMELKKKNVLKNSPSHSAKLTPKTTNQATARSKSQSVEKPTRQNTKILPKSEPIQKSKKTPNINPSKTQLPDKIVTKADTLPRNKKDNKPKKEIEAVKPDPVVTQCEDPATKVRELYEKVQKQQLMQMATLIEKQKKEQMILQKLFEEQQALLLKQLKTICPESPQEVKQAWGNSHEETGPVSLSQLIQSPTHKSPEQQLLHSTISLNDTNKYIDHCDKVLKRSKDISSALKRQTQSTSLIQQPSGQQDLVGSPLSPISNRRSTPASRKLNYDTSTSYDHEYEPLYTDRTNDTFADLNVTFPSDSDDVNQNTVIDNTSNDESAVSNNSAIKNIRDKLKKSLKESNTQTNFVCRNAPTQKELAAASKITAFARGYLVRRLLRTERVQGTVQTIKDALLCALQLHQDREGIRGADVDLHRRLIQQITAACYCLHDTFVVSSPAERCAVIAADRAKRRASAAKVPPLTNRQYRPTDLMSKSHTGAFPTRVRRHLSTSQMSQSSYDTFNSPKGSTCSSSQARATQRPPWR